MTALLVASLLQFLQDDRDAAEETIKDSEGENGYDAKRELL